MRRLDGITDSTDTSLSELWQRVKDGEDWRAEVHGVRVRQDFVTEQQRSNTPPPSSPGFNRDSKAGRGMRKLHSNSRKKDDLRCALIGTCWHQESWVQANQKQNILHNGSGSLFGIKGPTCYRGCCLTSRAIDCGSDLYCNKQSGHYLFVYFIFGHA